MVTKYPIILVHGIMLKDSKFFRAFGRIENILKGNGFHVYTAQIDGMGSIESNAQQLKEEILHILEVEHADKINIIAHSKGGLDSKYMIEELNMDLYVASLTALATPFKGSPIASNILKWPPFVKDFIAFWFNFAYSLFGDKNPDALKVCQQLDRVNTYQLGSFKTKNRVYYQSYSTELKRATDDFVMGVPLVFSKHFEEDKVTDGLVPEDSTIFGDYKGEAIDDSISHTEIVDFMAKKSKQEKIYHFYLAVCENLAKLGF